MDIPFLSTLFWRSIQIFAQRDSYKGTLIWMVIVVCSVGVACFLWQIIIYILTKLKRRFPCARRFVTGAKFPEKRCVVHAYDLMGESDCAKVKAFLSASHRKRSYYALVRLLLTRFEELEEDHLGEASSTKGIKGVNTHEVEEKEEEVCVLPLSFCRAMRFWWPIFSHPALLLPVLRQIDEEKASCGTKFKAFLREQWASCERFVLLSWSLLRLDTYVPNVLLAGDVWSCVVPSTVFWQVVPGRKSIDMLDLRRMDSFTPCACGLLLAVVSSLCFWYVAGETGRVYVVSGVLKRSSSVPIYLLFSIIVSGVLALQCYLGVFVGLAWLDEGIQYAAKSYQDSAVCICITESLWTRLRGMYISNSPAYAWTCVLLHTCTDTPTHHITTHTNVHMMFAGSSSRMDTSIWIHPHICFPRFPCHVLRPILMSSPIHTRVPCIHPHTNSRQSRTLCLIKVCKVHLFAHTYKHTHTHTVTRTCTHTYLVFGFLWKLGLWLLCDHKDSYWMSRFSASLLHAMTWMHAFIILHGWVAAETLFMFVYDDYLKSFPFNLKMCCQPRKRVCMNVYSSYV